MKNSKFDRRNIEVGQQTLKLTMMRVASTQPALSIMTLAKRYETDKSANAQTERKFKF